MENAQPYAAIVAQRVHEEIEASGRSRLYVSNQTGIAHSTLTRRLESGGASPFTVKELELIAMALAIDVTDLFPKIARRSREGATR